MFFIHQVPSQAMYRFSLQRLARILRQETIMSEVLISDFAILIELFDGDDGLYRLT
jgi:hypothetical protein